MDTLIQKCFLVEEELVQVEQRLQQIIRTGGPEIGEVGSYIFNGSGKRIRPTLFLLAAYRKRGNLIPLIDGAVAMELLHTASLLHDDVIDQSTIRRGKGTVHTRWSNKISVLTGDYLLSQSFKLLVAYKDWLLLDIIVDVVQNMTEGEMEQAFANVDTGELEQRYFQWIGKKSASFFAGCCQAGSHLSGGDNSEQSRWADYGFNLGLAFQLIDDLLDYTGKGSLTGKPILGDLTNRVITLPLIRTLSTSNNSENLYRILHDENSNESDLEAVVKEVLTGDGPQYTYDRAREYVAKACEVLNEMNDLPTEIKSALQEMTEDVLKRKK